MNVSRFGRVVRSPARCLRASDCILRGGGGIVHDISRPNSTRNRAARTSSVVKRKDLKVTGLGTKWEPILELYVQHPNTSQYPTLEMLVAVLVREFQSLELALIADLLFDAAHSNVDCTVAYEALLRRFGHLAHPPSAKALRGLSRLSWKLRDSVHGKKLADNVLACILANRKQVGDDFIPILWQARHGLGTTSHPLHMQLVAQSAILVELLLPTLPAVRGMQLLALCHHAASKERMGAFNSAVRACWSSGSLTVQEQNDMLLAMLVFMKAVSAQLAGRQKATLLSCASTMNVYSLRIDVAADLIAQVLFSSPSRMDSLSESVADHFLDNITELDSNSLTEPLTALCLNSPTGYRSKVSARLAQALPLATQLPQMSEWLRTLISVVSKLALRDEPALLDAIDVQACMLCRNWSANHMLWKPLALLHLTACTLPSRSMVEAVVGRMQAFRFGMLQSLGGTMYWLWAASVLGVDIPHELLRVVDSNVVNPIYQRDATLFLVHELQCMHRESALPFYMELDMAHFHLSKALCEQVVRTYGRHVCPLLCQLLASRPVWCAAFLLDEKRRMSSWHKSDITGVTAVSPDWLDKHSMHAVALAFEPDVDDPQRARKAKLDFHIWKGTVEARGWEVVIIKHARALHLKDVPLRNLIARQANIR